MLQTIFIGIAKSMESALFSSLPNLGLDQNAKFEIQLSIEAQSQFGIDKSNKRVAIWVVKSIYRGGLSH